MFTELTKDRLSNDAIIEALQSIEVATNDDLDTGIATIGREIILWYMRWLLTPSQRERLDKYKEYRKVLNEQEREEKVSQRLMLIEQNDEKPMIFQLWLVDGRIVVASTKTEIREKKEVEVANGGRDYIIEVYRDRTPLAYEYAKKNYQIYVPK